MMIDSLPETVLPAPSEARVKKVESYYGILLPEDYRAFLKHANGCVPLRRNFKLDDNVKVIERFLPMLDDARNDDRNGWADVAVVASQLDSRLASDPEGVNIDLIPIAALFAGDFVVLDYRGDAERPSVGVWDHEASTDFKPAVRTISGSFCEFLAKLSH